jgi:peptidoglycan/LPS O-acetylase OafA/YrhL
MVAAQDVTLAQTLHVGLCLPTTCTEADIVDGERYVSKLALHLLRTNQTTSLRADCSNSKTKWDGKAILAFCVFCLLLGICVVATAMDMCLQAQEKERKRRQEASLAAGLSVQDMEGHGAYAPLPGEPGETAGRDKTAAAAAGAADAGDAGADKKKHARKPRPPFIIAFLNAFRLNHNIYRLVAPSPVPSLTALNGLRGVCISGIVLGHTHLYLLNVGVSNPVYSLMRVFPRWAVVGMTGMELGVDAFFMLSGFLVAYGTLSELNKRGKLNLGMFYFHRFWRLTPALAFVLMLYICLSPYTGAGPNWNRYQKELGFPNTTPENSCTKYWWTVLTYVSNFYPVHFENQCFKWGWYLSDDTQFYVVSPLFLLAYHKNKRLGWLVTTAAMVLLMILRLAIIEAYHISLNPGHADAFMDKLYGKPYGRLPCYLVGFVMAYVYMQKQGQQWQMRPLWRRVGNLVAFVTLVSLVYGKYDFLQHPPAFHWSNRARNDLYLEFCRFGAAASAGWFMLMSFFGDGGIVRSVLGAHFWTPIGRLSYGTYLIHPALISILYFSASGFYQYTPLLSAYLFCTHLVLSFLGALVLYLLVEKPLMNLESVLFGGHGE